MENVRNIQLKTWMCQLLLLEIYWEHLVDNVITMKSLYEIIKFHLYEIIKAMCCGSFNEHGSVATCAFMYMIYGFIRLRKVSNCIYIIYHVPN